LRRRVRGGWRDGCAAAWPGWRYAAALERRKKKKKKKKIKHFCLLSALAGAGNRRLAAGGWPAAAWLAYLVAVWLAIGCAPFSITYNMRHGPAAAAYVAGVSAVAHWRKLIAAAASPRVWRIWAVTPIQCGCGVIEAAVTWLVLHFQYRDGCRLKRTGHGGETAASVAAAAAAVALTAK